MNNSSVQQGALHRVDRRAALAGVQRQRGRVDGAARKDLRVRVDGLAVAHRRARGALALGARGVQRAAVRALCGRECRDSTSMPSGRHALQAVWQMGGEPLRDDIVRAL